MRWRSCVERRHRSRARREPLALSRIPCRVFGLYKGDLTSKLFKAVFTLFSHVSTSFQARKDIGRLSGRLRELGHEVPESHLWAVVSQEDYEALEERCNSAEDRVQELEQYIKASGVMEKLQEAQQAQKEPLALCQQLIACLRPSKTQQAESHWKPQTTPPSPTSCCSCSSFD